MVLYYNRMLQHNSLITTTCTFGYESIVLSFLFGAISDIKNNKLVHCDVHASQLVRLLYASELVSVNHQNCLKRNKSSLSNEKCLRLISKLVNISFVH